MAEKRRIHVSVKCIAETLDTMAGLREKVGRGGVGNPEEWRHAECGAVNRRHALGRQ
jgi:hypothetical protein